MKTLVKKFIVRRVPRTISMFTSHRSEVLISFDHIDQLALKGRCHALMNPMS